MKKILSLILCLLMAFSLLTACGSTTTETTTESTTTESTEAAVELDMQAVVEAIETVDPVAMAQELSPAIEGSNDFMTELFGLDLTTVEDYYGKTTMVNVSSDVILIVKAVPGQVDAVKAALEARRDAVAASFEMYLVDQFHKASSGRVVTSGDYALLVIGDDTQEVVEYDSEDAMFAAIDEVYAEIDKAINSALNG